MASTHSIGFISLVCILVLLSRTRTGHFAPAHHLKIGVEGNTPTLRVTSAEIGITSNVEAATNFKTTTTKNTNLTTTTTPPLTSTKWLHKANQAKMKGKSLKSLYEKKRDKPTKEKMTKWQNKNLMLSSSVSPTVPQYSTTTTVKTLKTVSSSSTPKVTTDSNLITTAQPSEHPDIEAAKNNEFKAETKRTASLTTPPMYRHTEKTTTTTRSSLRQQMETMKSSTETSSSSIAIGKLPQTTASTESNSNMKIMVPSTTTTPKTTTPKAPKMITSTTRETAILPTPVAATTKTPNRNGNDGAFDGNIKAVPQAEKNDSKMKTTSTFAVNSTPSATPVITTEVNGVNGGDVSGTEGTTLAMTSLTTVENEVSDVVSHYSRVANRKRIAITTSPNLIMNTQISVNETIPTRPIKVSTIGPLSVPNSKGLKSTGDVDKVDEAGQHGIIKLIDLEKHSEPISIDELKTKGRTHLTDGGHDGIKQTKKKQLLDKHFIVDLTTELDFETGIETSTLLPFAPGKSIGNEKAENIMASQQNIEKPTITTTIPLTTTTTTLMPPTIHNEYLGPIRMDERTFSVQRSTDERQKAHEHEASIESKLHDGRIVEIIAPTALLEREDMAGIKATQKDVITTVEPEMHGKQQSSAVLSTTVFQVQEEASTSTTRKPINFSKSSERRESKISDIQIEVFDNVAEPTKFKYKNDEIKDIETEHGTTKPSLLLPTTQERFTQYVVDRTEASTPNTIIDANMTFNGIGKPEPAAIEIHINVSEGLTNQSEDLEFSYRPPENPDEFKENFDQMQTNSLSSRPQISVPNSQNESNNEHSDDILVVEIIDTGDNSTEIQSTSSGNVKPVLTFRAESSGETAGTLQMADELFLAETKRNGNGNENGNTEFAKPPLLPPPPPRSPTVDRDSDTIFYISNTEVKVGESPPSSINDDDLNGGRQEQIRRTKLENQFFPSNYVVSTYPNTESGQRVHPKHLYEEDIILSPISNTADSLKIFRSSQDDVAPPLDITYVGESVIEVEQSSGASTVAPTTTAQPLSLSPSSSSSQTPDVIIQPAILPEMSIGVPVIGELPPQIELKEIDFMPNEANQQRSGVYETENNDIEENLSDGNNDVDRLVESSIQYGGDLIDEGADVGAGFDGIEGSYPFGNMATMRKRTKNNGAADYAHFTMHHGVNNLRKDELSVDVGNAARDLTLGNMSNNENNTIFQSGNETLASMNITYTIAERIESNATAFSTAEQTEEVLQLRTTHEFGSFELLFIGGIILLLTVVTLLASYVSCHIYKRVHGNAQESDSSEMNLPNGNVARCDGGESGSKSSTQPPTPRAKEEPSEHDSDSTNDRNCLPVSDDSNFKKPSNNSNSLNIVNERHITDSSVNKRSTDARTSSRRTEHNEANMNGQSNNSVPDSYAGPNGSVTKMTLKNNHLIVETEERNDISRDARETKMHYTSDKDGVFVVEVARGADSKIIPESPIAELTDDHLFVKQPKLNGNNNKSPSRKYEDERSPALLNNHEQVQIHQPPTELNPSNAERSLHQIEEVEEEAMLSPKAETIVEMNFETNANTGLSQSDLSSTSSGDSNKRYSYGNQVLYTIDQTDYTSSSPVNVNVTPKRQTTDKIQDDDRKSENGHNLNETPEKSKGNADEHNEQKNESEEHVKLGEIAQNEISKQDEKLEGIAERNNEQAENEKVATDIEVEVEVEVEVKVEVEVEVVAEVEAEVELEGNDKREMQPDVVETIEIQLESMENIVAQEIETETETEKILSDIVKEIKDDSMSVSEVDCIVESITSETDATEKLTEVKKSIFNDVQQDALKADYEVSSLVHGETDLEGAYDSLMSLPDPPSNDEITQYSDFNGIETSQLDSLPPPPPALLTDENTNMPDIVAEIKSKSCQIQSINGNIEYYTGHGHGNGHGNFNGHGISDQNRAQALPLPPPILEEINSNGKILPNSPLTPPESPPPSPPAQYSNGVIGLNEQLCAASVRAVAVDVNGS